MKRAGSILVALLVLAAGCDLDHEQKFWSVEGHVRDLSGNPVQGAVIEVDIDLPVALCCPSPQGRPFEFSPDFSVRTNENGYYQVCLDAANLRTAILVSQPGYCFDRTYEIFERTTSDAEAVVHDFWGHAGEFHTIEGYVRHADGTPWTEDHWELDLRETQGRWFQRGWTDSAHYAFSVPACSLTFEVSGPAGCGGRPQVKRYEGVNRDFQGQDFVVGCPDVESEEYAVYSALIQQECLDPPQSRVRLIVLEDQTVIFGDVDELPGRLAYVQQHMPGVTGDMAADFEARNSTRWALGPHFNLTVPVVLLSQQEFSEILAEGGWEEFYRRYPGSLGETTISRVGFDTSGEKALVYLGDLCQGLCGWGYYFLLIKQQGAWSVEDEVLAWQS